MTPDLPIGSSRTPAETNNPSIRTRSYATWAHRRLTYGLYTEANASTKLYKGVKIGINTPLLNHTTIYIYTYLCLSRTTSINIGIISRVTHEIIYSLYTYFHNFHYNSLPLPEGKNTFHTLSGLEHLPYSLKRILTLTLISINNAMSPGLTTYKRTANMSFIPTNTLKNFTWCSLQTWATTTRLP